MSAVAERLPDPPLPLAPNLRADIARHRAEGRSWGAVGAALKFDPGALRRACEADPTFPAALDAAVEEAEREAELRALARLKRLTASDDERVALKASEVIVKYALQQRRERAEPNAVPAPKADPRPPVAVPKAPAARPVVPPVVRDPAPKPKPVGAFRAVPDLPPDKLAALLPEG